MRINMSNVRPMVSAAKVPQVRYSAAYPTDAPAPQASGCLSEANPKGRKGPRESVFCCGKRKLLWQFTVAIRCDPVAPVRFDEGAGVPDNKWRPALLYTLLDIRFL